jgi:hypothetical protein
MRPTPLDYVVKQGCFFNFQEELVKKFRFSGSSDSLNITYPTGI